ncbi:hypothetical protein H1D32_06810 [Anaerobacillus sp. CMMVII]|uniref:hypothetical protein n=1 Tax=Anaerobacillus sp. CMMVII TaxID=2755588 RepID=UPI0021B82076|nr:hypothetical protein [Anaerobacillus sp. CMMVII]MCT8137480.1 hypothetical protein [Anaerobacillus sp. CMMVII]
MLKDKKVDELIEIHKFGNVITINASEFENVFHEKFGNDTLALVAEQLENENPSLLEMITHIWWHYLYALYPISPEPLSANSWAAAIHKLGTEMTGFDEDELRLAKQYNVTVEEMLHCAAKIMKIEQETFKEY